VKTTGKILRVEYGFGLNREGNELYGINMKSSGENVWGVTLWLTCDDFTVTHFIGVTLSDYPTDEMAFEDTHLFKTIGLAGLLDNNNKRLISELVGVPVEIEHENGKLVSWKVIG